MLVFQNLVEDCVWLLQRVVATLFGPDSLQNFCCVSLAVLRKMFVCFRVSESGNLVSHYVLPPQRVDAALFGSQHSDSCFSYELRSKIMPMWIGLCVSEATFTRLLRDADLATDPNVRGSMWMNDSTTIHEVWTSMWIVLKALDSDNVRLVPVPFGASVKQMRIWISLPPMRPPVHITVNRPDSPGLTRICDNVDMAQGELFFTVNCGLHLC